MVNKNYKSHYNIRSQTLIIANKYSNVKLWANPVGFGYLGEIVREYKLGIDNYIVLKNPRRLTFGLPKGSADTIGFKIETIAGKKVPRFCAFEIKSRKDRPRPSQAKFLEMIRRSGGIAGLVRAPADLHRLLSLPLDDA